MFFWRRVAPQIPEEGLKPTATPGYTRNFRELNDKVSQGKSFSGYERNPLFLNQRGSGFAEIGGLCGVDFDDDARAVAVVDWDHDGDLDLWVTNRSTPQVRLLRNNQPAAGSSSANSFLAVRLIGNGTTTNRDAIGARLTLSSELDAEFGGRKQEQIRTVRAGDGFLAQSSAWTHFGLGQSSSRQSNSRQPNARQTNSDSLNGDLELSVRWPGGDTETFSALKSNSRYTIAQGEGRPSVPALQPSTVDLKVAQGSQQKSPAAGLAGFWVANQVPFPALTYTNEMGATRSTTELLGKPVLINFWATWCAPCVKELRVFGEHADELRAQGATVLALNVDGLAVDGHAASEANAAEELLSRVGYALPHGVARQENLAKIEILIEFLSSRRAPISIPASFLVDAKGNVAAVYLEAVSWEQLSNDLALLDASSNERLARASPRPGRWFADPRQLDRAAYLGDYATLFGTNGFPKESQRLYGVISPSGENRTAQQYYNQAKSASDQGSTKQAIAFYQAAIRLDPKYGQALTGLGAVMLKEKRVAEAQRLFEQALSIDPNHATALINLALIDQSQGNRKSALQRLQKVVARNPGYAQAQLNLGSLLASMKRYDDAIQHLSKAIDLSPKMLAAHLNLAFVYTKTEQWSKAEDHYRRVQQFNPRIGSAYSGLGNALAKQQRHADAVASYRKAISLGVRNAKTFTQLGLSLRALDKRQLARDAFKNALELDADYEEAKRALQEDSFTDQP